MRELALLQRRLFHISQELLGEDLTYQVSMRRFFSYDAKRQAICSNRNSSRSRHPNDLRDRTSRGAELTCNRTLEVQDCCSKDLFAVQST